jgi:FkbM family methyltransferase
VRKSQRRKVHKSESIVKTQDRKSRTSDISGEKKMKDQRLIHEELSFNNSYLNPRRTYDEDNIKQWIDTINPGENFYDLGACIGWFSLYAASIGLDVYSFEVDIQNFKGLVENIRLNPSIENKIQAYNQGIADSRRVVELACRNDSVGSHNKSLLLGEDFSASPEVQGRGNQKITQWTPSILRRIEVDSLDGLVQRLGIPYPDHLKVDIDGSEYCFLTGSPICLSTAKSMMIELWTGPGSKKTEECRSLISAHGFKLKDRLPIKGEKNLYNFWYTKR